MSFRYNSDYFLSLLTHEVDIGFRVCLFVD